uniref:Uncharacterized protein n=1 Tax=Candidatus Kentrum eta TaxID=2126337 RepID=A0A450VIV4_9GAMM|nr:MAG: hypothetical protein BECKH772B_GA0070898_104831 [Candidatus Kentron sp. H]VFK04964.1 MAG: hypothetical protein BECKH772A_GA0070896_104851 [Candidatus Kentron sp. H]VFK06869.1 MAG: hypothetical protein BECKH772C_GA0070978_103811 [Candidatus Kentron sp. H]
MNRISGEDYKTYLIGGWASPARERFNMPVYALPAFTDACGPVLMQRLAERMGGQFLMGNDVLIWELGELAYQKDAIIQKYEELLSAIQGEMTHE